MSIAIVWDDGVSLGPLADLRASFMVRNGAMTIVDRLRAAVPALTGAEVVAVFVPEELADLTRETQDLPVNEISLDASEPEPDGVLVVNGRLALPIDTLAELTPGSALVTPGGVVIAALLTLDGAAKLLESAALPAGTRTRVIEAPALLEQPWDVIRFRDDALDLDLGLLLDESTQELPPGVVAIGEEPIIIDPEALVFPTVVLDASAGPIVIDQHATVRPGAIIVGPAYIGAGSTVLDRAFLKAHTAIGPVCKVAGEVGGTIFQGFANKGHDGHLGDSWVGEWANLGAGTTNSNLLNTYSEVICQARPNAPRTRTGLVFLGCILGDHVKTAIMTRLMTGAVVGTGSMLAALTPPTCIDAFEWVTDQPGAGPRRQHFRFEKFLEVARSAMARRKMEPSEAYESRLRALCDGARLRQSPGT